MSRADELFIQNCRDIIENGTWALMAEKFMRSCPLTGWSLGTSGNSLLKNGPIILERTFIAPAFSPIFISPSHRIMTPPRGRAIFITANSDMWNVLRTMRSNTM